MIKILTKKIERQIRNKALKEAAHLCHFKVSNEPIESWEWGSANYYEKGCYQCSRRIQELINE